ncbi:MAG: DUF1573 domain-containing protein [Verrucomicrobiota bacterium]
MKFPPINAVLLCAALMATPLLLSGQTASPAGTGLLGPRLIFATNEFHFGRVDAGTPVHYTFIVSNAGDQTLVISKVLPGCRCITAEAWDHAIEPGKTGKIPVQFDSTGFQDDVSKSIGVMSNDKLAPSQNLLLQGTVWSALKLTPQFAQMMIVADELSNLTTTVQITNQSDQPVTLSKPTSTSDSFKTRLRKLKPGWKYELVVDVVPPFGPGSLMSTISIPTSLTNMPVLHVTAVAMIMPGISVIPTQINLPPQLDDGTTNVTTIQANGSKIIALSNPESSDPRVSVELKEITPGRLFKLIAVFPPGFKMAPGQSAQLSVKSSIARNPLIEVPIFQPDRAPNVPMPVGR